MRKHAVLHLEADTVEDASAWVDRINETVYSQTRERLALTDHLPDKTGGVRRVFVIINPHGGQRKALRVCV